MKLKYLIAFTFSVLFTGSISAQPTLSMVDKRDGKTYEFTKTGDKWWMSDILGYKTFIGSRIADEGTFTSGNRAGSVIYDWATALTVCPAGWILPGKEDYVNILNEYGYGKVSEEALYDSLPRAMNVFAWTSTSVDDSNAYLYYVVFNAGGKIAEILESPKKSFFPVKCMTTIGYLLDQQKEKPNDFELLKTIAYIYLSEDNYDDAMEYLNKALAFEPKNKFLFYARGYAYEMMDQYDEAVMNYNSAIEIDPEYFEVIYTLGIYNYNMAAKIYNQSVESNNLSQVNYYLRRALPHIQKICSMEPGDETLNKILNIINQQLNKKN